MARAYTRKPDAIREADHLIVTFPSGPIRWQVKFVRKDTVHLITPAGKDYVMDRNYLAQLMRAGGIRRETPIEMTSPAILIAKGES